MLSCFSHPTYPLMRRLIAKISQYDIINNDFNGDFSLNLMQSVVTVSVIPMTRCGKPYGETRCFSTPSFHLYVLAAAYFKCGQESLQDLPTQG